MGGWRGGARLHPGVPDEQRAAEDQGEVGAQGRQPAAHEPGRQVRDGGRQAGQPGDAEQPARQRPVARQQQRRQASGGPQDKEQPPRPGSGE
ncbi:hypothetical protein [Pseudomonas aeruginosa]|uniref:hypothetical protein n=1 Tax=Pseudomonas aeruginosa TaxID=287 RepID=UPI001ADA653F